MFLKSLKITNFKSFYSWKEIKFAIPNWKKWSWITVMTWANNSWKSTVFDAIKKLFPNEKITENERNNSSVKILFKDSEWKNKELNNINTWSQINISWDSILSINNFELISSRRSWNHRFNWEMNYDQYMTNRNNEKNKLSVDGNLGTLLSKINKDNEIKAKFNWYLKKIFDDFNDWTIDTDEQWDYVRYISKSWKSHVISLTWDGIISVFRIISHIVYTTDNKILLIDEPELSLQPQAIKRLSNIITEISSNKQVIIATHSPYFIHWENIINWAEIYKLSKEEDKETKVYKINKLKEYFRNITNQNYQTPHLMDLVSKEIFFTQNILFLEWQEDVALINKFILENEIDINFSIFWYWSWWAEKIDSLIDFAKDLWIKKVWAVFDNDKSDLVTDLSEKYSNFFIKSISKDDIRDKYKYKVNKTQVSEKWDYLIIDWKTKSSKVLFKSWLFDSKWNIKVSSKEELNILITDFINYCNN